MVCWSLKYPHCFSIYLIVYDKWTLPYLFPFTVLFGSLVDVSHPRRLPPVSPSPPASSLAAPTLLPRCHLLLSRFSSQTSHETLKSILGPVHPMQAAAPSSPPPGRNTECVLLIHPLTLGHVVHWEVMQVSDDAVVPNCGAVLWAWGCLVWCCGVNGLKGIDGAGGVISETTWCCQTLALIAGLNHFPSLSISLCHPPSLSFTFSHTLLIICPPPSHSLNSDQINLIPSCTAGPFLPLKHQIYGLKMTSLAELGGLVHGDEKGGRVELWMESRLPV